MFVSAFLSPAPGSQHTWRGHCMKACVRGWGAAARGRAGSPPREGMALIFCDSRESQAHLGDIVGLLKIIRSYRHFVISEKPLAGPLIFTAIILFMMESFGIHVDITRNSIVI